MMIATREGSADGWHRGDPHVHAEADAYFLMRAYRSVDERQQSQDAFYGSDEWRNGPREAIVSEIETLISVVVPAELVSRAGG